MRVPNYLSKFLADFVLDVRHLFTGRQDLIIFCYHFVTDKQSPFTENGHNIDPGIFRQQIRLLSSHFEIIDLRDLYNLHSYDYKRPLAAISFDDGYACVFSEAHKILENQKVPATIFLNSSVVGNRSLLWRDKVRYLISSGLENEFICFLRQKAGAKSYDISRLHFLNFYKWSKDPRSIHDFYRFMDQLEEFYSQQGLDSTRLAEQYNLYCSPDDIRDYTYLSFGNHTDTHPLMAELSLSQQGSEIERCQILLREKGVKDVGLALPFHPYSDNTLLVCRELGYEFVFTARGRSNPLPLPYAETPVLLDRKLALNDLLRFSLSLAKRRRASYQRVT